MNRNFANRNFAQRAQLKKIGIIVLLIGLVVGLTACVAFWQAPVAVLEIDSPLPMDRFEVPLTVIFDIEASRGRGQDIVNFTLDFGDGTPAHEGTDLTLPIEHTYTEAGFFRAVLTVTDAAGATDYDREHIDTLPVHVYYSYFDPVRPAFIHRVRVHDRRVDKLTGPFGTWPNLFPSLVLNTRDKIAFTAAGIPPGNWNIWTMTTEGTLHSQLTATADPEIQPTWSHDGDEIAYARHTGGLWEIWTMTATGAGEAMLITQTPSDVWAPAFSPINDDLVFVKEVGAVSELWIRRAGVVDPVRLHAITGVRVGDPSAIMTPSLAEMLGLPAGAGISQPRWSPDGTKIVFARERAVGGPTIDIHVLDVATRTSQTLEAYVAALPGITADDITTDANEFSPHWLEDGNIVFIRESTTVPGEFQLFHVDLTTGRLRYLTEPGVAIMPARQ